MLVVCHFSRPGHSKLMSFIIGLLCACSRPRHSKLMTHHWSTLCLQPTRTLQADEFHPAGHSRHAAPLPGGLSHSGLHDRLLQQPACLPQVRRKAPGLITLPACLPARLPARDQTEGFCAEYRSLTNLFALFVLNSCKIFSPLNGQVRSQDTRDKDTAGLPLGVCR